jgi:hypothetical protein
MINYIAVEPIVQGESWRSFSELEESMLDREQGLRFWSADAPTAWSPRDPSRPSQGIVTIESGVETLTVYVFVEAYRSGACVMIRLRFRSDRPYEVGLATFRRSGSKPLANCILTATMGNFARLRTLHLAGGTRSSLTMWPGFSGDGFAEHRCFELADFVRTPLGDALFIATPNESDPANAEYAPGTFIGWHYYGEVATQYWKREDPTSELRGCVNARRTYWASSSEIPGGVSFENFELVEPFHPGTGTWFGVIPGLWDGDAAIIQPMGTD